MSSIKLMRGIQKSFAPKLARSNIFNITSRSFSSDVAVEKLELERQHTANLEKEKKLFVEYLLKKPTLEERRVQNRDLYPSVYSVMATIQNNDCDSVAGSYIQIDENHVAPYLRKSIAHEIDACGNYFMVRPYAAEIMNKMMHVKPGPINNPKKPFGIQEKLEDLTHENMYCISGHRGTGKTYTLATAVAFAHQNNWAVLALSLDMFTQDRLGFIVESKTEPGIFEQRLVTREFFETNWSYMKDAFSKIKLQGDYSAVNWEFSLEDEWNVPENPELLTRYNQMIFPDPNVIPKPSGTPQTAADLIALGAWRGDLSYFCFKALLFEMQHTTDVPCLIAIDNINAAEQVTEFKHPQRLNKLKGKKLSVPHALIQSLAITPAYGMTITAVSSQSTMKNVHDYIYRARNNVVVGTYNLKEMQCALEHYSASKFTHIPLDITLLRGVEGLTGRVPLDLRKWCSYN